MKYVIIGGAGNTSRPLAEKLLKAGQQVTVVGRKESHMESLKKQGAEVAIGSVEDPEFIKKIFSAADAVYTMVPPKFDIASNWKEHIGNIGKIYRDAIKGSSIQYVVNLSSVGAHLPDGCGPVSGLYKVENALNELKEVNIRHLRPAYFYVNFLGSIDLVKNMNIIGSNFGGEGFKFPLADTNDIAEVAAEELLSTGFNGHSVRYIASDEPTTDEIASVIGEAIGKPELRWVVFSDQQAAEGLQHAGFTEEIARNYAEMGHAFNSGKMLEDYWKHRPIPGSTKMADFAKVFAKLYTA